MRRSAWFIVLLLSVTIINYPNPFNPQAGESVTFECTSGSTLDAQLFVYDMSARLVVQKLFSLAGGAVNRTSWDGYTSSNALAANGIYLYRLIDLATKKSLAKGKVWIINH